MTPSTASAHGPLARRRERGRVARRDQQLPEVLERLAASMRSGRGLSGALADVAAGTPEPLGAELTAAATAVAQGTTVGEAVADWADDAVPSSDLDLALAALALGAVTGGEVARALDRVAATLRERRELRGEARALATQARASAAVLTIAPVAFALLVSAIEPGVVGFLVTSPAGLVCLGAGLGLDLLGAAWMARIVAEVR